MFILQLWKESQYGKVSQSGLFQRRVFRTEEVSGQAVLVFLACLF